MRQPAPSAACVPSGRGLAAPCMMAWQQPVHRQHWQTGERHPEPSPVARSSLAGRPSVCLSACLSMPTPARQGTAGVSSRPGRHARRCSCCPRTPGWTRTRCGTSSGWATAGCPCTSPATGAPGRCCASNLTSSPVLLSDEGRRLSQSRLQHSTRLGISQPKELASAPTCSVVLAGNNPASLCLWMVHVHSPDASIEGLWAPGA